MAPVKVIVALLLTDSETNGQRDERSSPSIFFYITFLSVFKHSGFFQTEKSGMFLHTDY